MAAARSGSEAEREVYAGFVDRFFDHNLSGFFGLRDAEKKPFSPAQIRAQWRGLAAEIRRGRRAERADFYLSIPFCRDICSYCNLSPEKLGRRARVKEYLDWLDDALRYFAPAFQGLRFDNLLVGGGTPSALGAAELERLFSRLFRRFRFRADGERSFEFHPGSFSESKLDVLRRFGFNRMIIGVQTLTPGVLRRVGRGGQTAGSVRAAVKAVRARGFERGQNLDLIMGLEGETPAGFLRSFERTVALRPEEISVYLLKPFGPHMSSRYGRSVGRFYEDKRLRETFAGVPREMNRIARGAGYRVNESPLLDLRYGYSLKGLRPRPRYYSDTPLGGRSLFGLGSMARSHVCGRLAYSCGAVRGKFDPAGALFEGQAVDLDVEMMRYISHHLLGEFGMSRQDFRAAFGESLGSRFGGVLRRLRHLGLVRAEGDRLFCASRGMRDRLITRLFFVGPERLRGLLDAHNAPENQARLILDGEELDIWVERPRRGQEYVLEEGGFGLQVRKVSGGGFSPAERKCVEWLRRLFRGSVSDDPGHCAAELTWELHRRIGGFLGGEAAGNRRITLKPWITAEERSGLGYVSGGAR